MKKKIKQFILLFLALPLCCLADTNDTRLLQDISGKLNAQLDTLRSWSQENNAHARDLLNKTNAAKDLAIRDHLKPDPSTWAEVDALNEKSLGLLHASSALWQSYGNFNAYLASFNRAEAWSQCAAQKNRCSFKDAIVKLDSRSVEYATQAVQAAEISQQAISEQIRKLESFAFQARSSEGLSSGIDALSKVNAASAASLVDLTNGINTMLKIQAHEAASAHTLALAQEEGSKQILQGGTAVHSPHFNLRISDHVH